MQGHEEDGDIACLDAHGKEEAADLAKRRIGLNNAVGELDDGVYGEPDGFEHVSLH